MAGNNIPPTSVHFKKMSRGKNWMFTLNNYTAAEEAFIQSLPSSDPDVIWLTYGRELGEQTGTPHLQGYLCLARRLRLQQLRQKLPRCHLEIRRGSHADAKRYCQKDADFEEHGVEPESGQGTRTDLETLKNSLDNGLPLRDIADAHFATFLRYNKGIKLYVNLNARSRDWVTSVVVYWGRTGAGKTRAVYENLPNPNSLYTHPGGPWFDGYEGQAICLFDDFSGSCFQLPYLLKILDRYPMQVPVKGAFVNWAPYEIYITSNINPCMWYRNAHPEHVAALMRRISNCVKFE